MQNHPHAVLHKFLKHPHVERNIKKDAWMRFVLEQDAKAAASVARQTAPVHTGAYRDGIEGEVEYLGHHIGWRGRVVGYDWKTHWIEFGTATGFRARGTLRNACRKIGLKVVATK